ncbi:MAG TPA: sugar ABC transporter substrate-binding protein [Clostridiales bacterium]|nr:sugar ABC transporter substrate-binding protein [Clostridiales bacterium]
MKFCQMPQQNQYTFGWSVYNSNREFFHTMQEGVFAAAAELGITILPHNQNGETEEMINGSLNLLSQGINALIISPVNPQAMGVIADMANQENIPIVVVDVGTGGVDVAAFIISDNYGGGILAGEYALTLLQEYAIASHNVVIIKVEPTSTFARQRGNAFRSVLTDAGYQVVAEADGNSDTMQAYELMKGFLAAYQGNLAIAFCENDLMALGAAQAVLEAGKRGQILILGFDGIPSAIEAIKQGLMQGTIAQQPFEMGRLGVQSADTVLKGGEIIFDDVKLKELYVPVYLIDQYGHAWK